MLDRIRLQNFKTHRNTEIKLGRLTVLVGPNGAGKSSVLQAIRMVQRLESPVDPALTSVKTIAHEGESVGWCTVTVAGTVAGGQPWAYEFADGPPSGVAPKIHVRPAQWAGAEEQQSRESQLAATLLMPNPAQLAAPVPVSVVAPKLASDGSGLADVVAKMQLEDNDAFQALQSSLRAVVPQIQRIGVRRINITRPVKDADILAHELTFDVSGRKGISAGMMSGGTLLALGILALLHSPARPRILLLDDIDHGLHPRAQWDLLKQLRALLDRFPDLQIVATSHSPDLVDELAPEEVVVMALREDGTTAARPLTDCPREDMLGVLKAGQLWSAVGEDWVKDMAPAEPAP